MNLNPKKDPQTGRFVPNPKQDPDPKPPPANTGRHKNPKHDPQTGRYLPGTGGGPGRSNGSAGRSLTAALKDKIEPEELARMLLERACKSDTVLMYVYDRIEGRPRQALEYSVPEGGPVRLTWDDGTPANESEEHPDAH